MVILTLMIMFRFFPRKTIAKWTGVNWPKLERTCGMLLPGFCASFTFSHFKVMMEMADAPQGDSPFVTYAFWMVVGIAALVTWMTIGGGAH